MSVYLRKAHQVTHKPCRKKMNWSRGGSKIGSPPDGLYVCVCTCRKPLWRHQVWDQPGWTCQILAIGTSDLWHSSKSLVFVTIKGAYWNHLSVLTPGQDQLSQACFPDGVFWPEVTHTNCKQLAHLNLTKDGKKMRKKQSEKYDMAIMGPLSPTSLNLVHLSISWKIESRTQLQYALCTRRVNTFFVQQNFEFFIQFLTLHASKITALNNQLKTVDVDNFVQHLPFKC